MLCNITQNLFLFQHVTKLTLKKEVDRLVKTGLFKLINDSQCEASPFIIPEIYGTVRFVSDFRNLNKAMKIKTFPIPNNSRFVT